MASSLQTRSLTQPEMVLVSFYRVAKGMTAKVPYEELVLQAWRDFPEAFSLRNHPEHPDASDIHKKLYQSLKSTGLVVSLGNKVFRLTEKGLAQARDLIAEVEGQRPVPIQEKLRLARDEQRFIEHALRSRAFTTWRATEKDKLVDYDARLFFQFSTGTAVAERKRKVEFAQEAITKAVAVGIDGAIDLDELATFLLQRFNELLQEA
jgi:hypothetical protein